MCQMVTKFPRIKLCGSVQDQSSLVMETKIACLVVDNGILAA